MIRALDELAIEGISTTAVFHKRVLSDPEFVDGHFFTSYVENKAEILTKPLMPDTEVGAIAAAVEVYLLTRRSMPRLTEREAYLDGSNPWKLAGRRRSMMGLG
jgi:acetyl-CoA carboxylase biotin carboxylase subunit